MQIKNYYYKENIILWKKYINKASFNFINALITFHVVYSFIINLF